MIMKTQILSHYSANKSSDIAALCGRAGHLIKTALKKKKKANCNQLLRVTQGFLQGTYGYLLIHVPLWRQFRKPRRATGRSGRDGPADSSGRGPVWGQQGDTALLDTQHWAPAVWVTHSPQPREKQWYSSLQKSWPPTPNVSDSSCHLHIHATPCVDPWYWRAHGIK